MIIARTRAFAILASAATTWALAMGTEVYASAQNSSQGNRELPGLANKVSDYKSVHTKARGPSATAMKVEIIPSGRRKKVEVDASEELVGDILVRWGDGRSERLTYGAHGELAKVGPGGLIGWTWAKERFIDSWVNTHLRIQRKKRFLFEIKAAMAFIEEWAFTSEGLVVKSRGRHGPARIELFSLSTGRRLQLIEKAYEDDDGGEHLPVWAKPFAD